MNKKVIDIRREILKRKHYRKIRALPNEVSLEKVASRIKSIENAQRRMNDLYLNALEKIGLNANFVKEIEKEGLLPKKIKYLVERHRAMWYKLEIERLSVFIAIARATEDKTEEKRLENQIKRNLKNFNAVTKQKIKAKQVDKLVDDFIKKTNKQSGKN